MAFDDMAFDDMAFEEGLGGKNVPNGLAGSGGLLFKRAMSPRPLPDATALLNWYDRHRRDLPWRAKPGQRPDPYAVWLSEIMLQQTTVEAVKSYYARFLHLWPDVQALAAAPIDAVMRAWAGLGYYSRARNLHACAQVLVRDHGGRFPADETAIRALPGIGAYTAAAVTAIAFGRRAIVVDGNVERVVSRLFAVDDVLPKAKPGLRRLTDNITPARRPGDFAQGMMDLGSMVCTPRRPICPLCPFEPACAARAAGTPEAYPRKAPKAGRPRRYGAAFVIRRGDGQILVRTRAAKGLLGGMTEVPNTPWAPDFDIATAFAYAPLAPAFRETPGRVEHVFTHFALELRVFVASVAATTPAPDDHRWVGENDLDDEALPTLMRKVLAHGLAHELGAPDPHAKTGVLSV